nr:DUF4113 domain-containing protein [uncultured Acidocella sp.]
MFGFQAIEAIFGGVHFGADSQLNELTPAGQQPGLFSSRDKVKSAAAIAAMDAINARSGREMMRMASTGIARPWRARQQQLSPRYTTRADEILIGRAF